MSRGRSNRGRREANDFSNRRLPFSSEAYRRFPSTSHIVAPLAFGGSDPLLVFEDRRQWHPEGATRPARSFSSPRHRLVAHSRSTQKNPDRFASVRAFPASTFSTVAFAAPSRVLICVRRQIRREVMHAMGHAGKVGQRRPRYSEYSSISCRG